MPTTLKHRLITQSSRADVLMIASRKTVTDPGIPPLVPPTTVVTYSHQWLDADFKQTMLNCGIGNPAVQPSSTDGDFFDELPAFINGGGNFGNDGGAPFSGLALQEHDVPDPGIL